MIGQQNPARRSHCDNCRRAAFDEHLHLLLCIPALSTLPVHLFKISENKSSVSQNFEQKQAGRCESEPREKKARQCALEGEVAVKFLKDCTDNGNGDDLPS